MIDAEGGTAPDAAKLEALAQGAEADPTGEAPPAPASAPVADQTGPVAVQPVQGGQRKAGRPPGSKTRNRTTRAGVARPAASEPPAQKSRFSRATIKAAIRLPYAVAAKRYGDHWELSDEEAETMVDDHMAVADEYIGPLVDKHAGLYSLAFLHCMIIFGKADIHFRLKAERERREQEANAAARRVDTVPPKPGPGVTSAGPIRSVVRPGPRERPPGT